MKLNYNSLNSKKYPLILVIISFLIRIVFIIDTNKILFIDFECFINEGKAIMQNGIGALQVYHAPLYPVFIGLIFKITKVAEPISICILQAILGTINTLLIYLIAKNIFNRKVAALAGTASLLYWPLTLYSGIVLSEILFIFLSLMAVYFLFKLIDKKNIAYAIFTGMFLGLSVCTRSINSLLIYMFIAIIIYFHRKEVRIAKLILILIVMILAYTIMVAPWLYRSYKLIGEPTMDTLGGLNLYIGNNKNNNTGQFIDITNDPVYLLSDGERKEQAIQFIKNNPIKFSFLTIKRMLMYLAWDFIEKVDWVLEIYLDEHFIFKNSIFMGIIFFFDIIFIITGYAGLFFLTKSKKGLILLVLITYYFLLTSVFYISGRYRLPIMPFLSIASGNLGTVLELNFSMNRRASTHAMNFKKKR